MAFFGQSATANEIANAIQSAIGNNATAQDIATEIFALEGVNASAQDIGTEVANDLLYLDVLGQAPHERVSKILDINGDGTGVKNAIGNYSGGITDFKFTIPPGKVFRFTELRVDITDVGDFSQATYGNNINLTNGIDLIVKTTSGGEVSAFDGLKVLTNKDWAFFLGQAQFLDWNGGGGTDQTLIVSNPEPTPGTEFRLDGDDGGEVIIRLNDNFTGLVSHRFLLRGFYE